MNKKEMVDHGYSPDNPDEMEVSVSDRDVCHLFQYFTRTDQDVPADPEYLLEQYGITAQELEWILSRQ